MTHSTQQLAWLWETLLRTALAAVIVLVLAIVMPGTAQAQTFTVLHNFAGPEGSIPSAGVTMDQARNLYGTAGSGGNNSCGTVFKLARKSSGWLFTPLYSFAGPDGCSPRARVIIGPDGSLYGTTIYGGASNRGTVFNLRPPAGVCKSFVCPWMETVLHSFQWGSDGQWPQYGDLAFDSGGSIYGTTPNGGGGPDCSPNPGCGVVYKLTPTNGGWTESIVHIFQGNHDGLVPYAGVVLDQAGNLYGTTLIYGATGLGAVYELTPSGAGWTERILYRFSGTDDGGIPYGGLIFDQSGNLFGTTSIYGAQNSGTVYELTPSNGSWTFNLLYSFTAYAGSNASLAMDAAGNLYGTLAFADTEVFRLTPSNGAWTQTCFNGAAGNGPLGNVVLDANGNLYTTATDGGTYGVGVVFEITP